MEEQNTTNNVTQTEQVQQPVQENAEVVENKTLNESPLESSTTDVTNQEGITEPPKEENSVQDHPEVSEEIQKKLEKLKEYEVKENELTELRNRLGSEAPRDNLIFGAQRELAIVENQAQQDYIYLCNKYGVDYRPDKIDASAQELLEKDPKAFYELKFELNKLTENVNAKREQVETFIKQRDMNLAMEKYNNVINTSPAIKNVLNHYMQNYNMSPADIDNVVQSSMDIAREAFEMGRQAALQEKANTVNPAKVLNDNVITQQSNPSAEGIKNDLTLADVANMDLKTYAKNAKLIDRLIFEGKIK